jgi:hypothetical protein
MGLIALFHRRGLPSTEEPEYEALDREDRNRVKLLSLIVRLVESLDRSHQNAVRQACVLPSDAKEFHLRMCVDGDAQLELWGLRSREKAVRKTLGRHLVVDVVQPADACADCSGEQAPASPATVTARPGSAPTAG